MGGVKARQGEVGREGSLNGEVWFWRIAPAASRFSQAFGDHGGLGDTRGGGALPSAGERQATVKMLSGPSSSDDGVGNLLPIESG